MNSDDDMPLDSLVGNHVTPEKDGKAHKLKKDGAPELKRIKISDSQYVIRMSQIEKAEEKITKFIKESLSFDDSKFKLELFSSVLVKIIPKITENGNSENKENEPELTNGKEDALDDREDEIEHINNGNDFEIEDIGTFDEPAPERPEKAPEKKKVEEKPDSESEEEIELIKDRETVEAFWYLEDGIVKSAKEVPSHFKNDDGSGPKLDCSVGGLYYKIYADNHERRMAASIVIKPAHITHRKLHLQEENRNFPDTVSYMAAVKDTYLEKMLNSNSELSIQTFCNQCFRCFATPYDLQVHKELVHQTQHAATCRICEFNFSEPALLLKHMAAVHSMETPPQGLLGAYRCMICRFMSPLYTELTRHYNEYHSRSGWLLCPLCLRVFSNDTTYEHHMNTHITKGRFFRCQSCRLVFESENFRMRHEQEMHHSTRKTPTLGPQDFNPKVPTHVRAWVRGDADNRSRICNADELDCSLACRAICLNDCTDPESIKKSQEKKKRPKIMLKPMNEVTAPKAFQATILEGKTRGSRLRAQNSDLIENKEEVIPKRDGPILNDMAELLLLLDEKPKKRAKKNPGVKSEEKSVKTADEEGLLKSEPENGTKNILENGIETDSEVESDIPEFKPVRCLECYTMLNNKEELNLHFSSAPLKSQRNSFESHCPVKYLQHQRSFLNGPSLETVRVKSEWLHIGKQLLKSYPNGIKCSCGKSDFDFGNMNMIAKHMIFNSKHTLTVVESEAHKDEVRNRVLSQRIKRLIQTGQYTPLKQENLEHVIKSKPLSILNHKQPSGEREKFDEKHDLFEFGNMFHVTKRKERKKVEAPYQSENHEERGKLGCSASGIDIADQIITRKSEIRKLSKKEERLMTSVLHKANVERQTRLKQQTIQQQQQQQYQLQLQQQYSLQQKQLLNSTNRYGSNNLTSNRSNIPNVSLSRDLLNRSQIGQKRAGTPLSNQVVKQTARSMPASRNTRPTQAKDVKFPVVTHKEIQVEIVPSEVAKKNNDIEFYEIEFKGRKTPNKYNVKPNIKIVKLIGLQSDTRYLIKVFAVRNSIRSDPVVRHVRTTPLPRGNGPANISDVIELD